MAGQLENQWFESFRREFAAHRAAKGLGYKTIAKELGTFPINVSRVERGENEPSLGFAADLADIVGMKFEIGYGARPSRRRTA